LEELCKDYWYPLYAYARRAGCLPHDSEDLVQGFFARLLAKDYLASADRGKGRFRSFLLVLFKRFLANERDRCRAWKRGGARPLVALDGLNGEDRYALEPPDTLTPDALFERRWALTLLETVLERLRKEQEAQGAGERFNALKETLVRAGDSHPYAELARRLRMSEGAIKVAVHRLRQRYPELLVEQIAHTVDSAAEVEEERRYLLRVLSCGG
jgi:RNA polymerase sigma-70 factor (ECF subfamily)